MLLLVVRKGAVDAAVALGSPHAALTHGYLKQLWVKHPFEHVMRTKTHVTVFAGTGVCVRGALHTGVRQLEGTAALIVLGMPVDAHPFVVITLIFTLVNLIHTHEFMMLLFDLLGSAGASWGGLPKGFA